MRVITPKNNNVLFDLSRTEVSPKPHLRNALPAQNQTCPARAGAPSEHRRKQHRDAEVKNRRYFGLLRAGEQHVFAAKSAV